MTAPDTMTSAEASASGLPLRRTKPVIPEGLRRPAAKLIARTARRIKYLCFCGREASCSPQEWEAGIEICSCTGVPVEYPRRDMAGVRFTRLTVVSWAGKRLESPLHHYWHCRCDCGTKKVVSFASLSSGATRSCGCLAKDVNRSRRGEMVKDLVGQRFGMLTVVKLADRLPGSTSRNARWECVCDCGNVTTASAPVLKDGKVRSCGCLLEQGLNLTGLKFKHWTALTPLHKRGSDGGGLWECVCDCGKHSQISSVKLRVCPPKCGCSKAWMVMSGMRFGMLTTVAKRPRAKPGETAKWLCRCDCGNEREIAGYRLFENGSAYSCGCTAQWIPHTILPSSRNITLK